MTVRRLRSFAGLAAAIVPCAIVVHIVAEAAAVGGSSLGAAFLVRHWYFGGLVTASALWFASTAGLGQSARERRRRCALLRADLDTRRSYNLLLLIGANLGFFGLTQAVEGIPISSGAVVLGLGVALAGSLLAALMVFAFGPALIEASLESAIATSPLRRAAVIVARRGRGVVSASRRATSAYSLFIPNRPPPFASSF